MAKLTIDVNVKVKFDRTVEFAIEQWCWRNKITEDEKNRLYQIIIRAASGGKDDA